MEKFVGHKGKTVSIDLANIDTDQIIPKQFLKRIERTGYGEFLFYDWRFSPSGEVIEDFVLNRPESVGASVLITGENFGCGSSREHAPWSLLDYGFHVVIAPNFADIFYNNSLKTGLLPVRLPAESVEILSERARSDAEYRITVNLESLSIADSHGFKGTFELDEFRRYCLLNGLDDIGLTLQRSERIGDYEERIRQSQPFLALSA